MKLKCAKEDIITGLQAVQAIAGGKGTLPILANVLVEAGENEVVLTTTDLEVGMTRRVPSKVSRKGAISLPAKRLFAILREMPEQEVTLEAAEAKEVVIRYGTSYFKLLGLPKEDFPPLPDLSKVRSIKVPQGALSRVVRLTHYAISHDESRFVLNGLYIILSKNKLTGVATDGRRLALCEEAVVVPEGADRAVIIPTKAVVELGRILSGEGDVQMFMGDSQIAFAAGDCTLVTRLVEGHFPNYQQVIPAQSKHRLVLDRDELLNATRRVALMTSEQSNSVRFALKKNRLIISTNTPDVGEAREELTISYGGEEVAIAFNPQYVLDVLKNLIDKEVVFEFTDALNPGVVKSGKSFLYVIMPIRLS